MGKNTNFSGQYSCILPIDKHVVSAGKESFGESSEKADKILLY
jgi:hypothetical protein